RSDQTPVRSVLDVSCVEDPPFVRIHVTAQSFLHQMVRSIVGTALEVGAGRRSPAWMRDVLAATDRAAAGPVAPAHGLTLTDAGDFVIVVNAEKVKLTGNKLDGKMYVRHSEYPGGLTQIPYRRLLATHPERAIEHAVKGMLPHNTLGRKLGRKLKVYRGPSHP